MTNESNAGESAGETVAGRRAAEPTGLGANIPGGVPAVVAVVLLLAAAGAWFVFGGGGDENDPTADCFVETIRLTTASELRPMVDEAVKAVKEEEPCLDIQVTDGAVKDVIAQMADPDAHMPDLWIPDSPTWQGQLNAAGYRGSVVTPSVAESPVGLVSGPSGTAPRSWLATLETGQLAMGDPSADGASALALLAPYAESKQTGATPEGVAEATVPVAQRYGEQSKRKDQVNDPAGITGTSVQLIPMTERDYLVARRSNDQLTMVAPHTGVPVLHYPIVSVTKANMDVLSSSSEGTGARAGRALAHWFASESGRTAVAEAEFRVPGTSSKDLLASAKPLRKVNQATTDEVLRSWRVLTVPSSMLVLIDVSGSMDFEVAGKTRIQLTAEAAATALDVLPDQARIGLWVFSIDQGGKGVDYKQLAPIKQLSATTHGMTQKEYLHSQVPRIAGMTKGGTGLYDTTFAAFKQALKDYDAAWFNSVVILTDGSNDDPGSLSEAELLASIERMRDPSRPVKIIPVGISNDADMGALRKIAAATGSKAYQAVDPKEILLVLAQALLDR